MANDPSPWEPQVGMEQLANAGVGEGQPQPRFTTVRGSSGTSEWTDEEEARSRSTGMPTDLVSRQKESDITESTSIHFVTESGRKRPDGKSRTLIRSLARRKPENRVTVSRELAVIAKKDENVKARYDIDRDHSSTRQKQQYRDGDLNPFPGKAVVDPFGTLPVSDVGNSQFFIHYYDTIFTETWAPVNPRKQYLPFVMTDAALLHATLTHSAIRHDMLHGNAAQDAAYHKAKAIQIINQRLRDPELACTDATITAVACLTLFETLQGSAASAKLHMDGLEAMVKSRGGIGAIKEGSHTKKLTTWIDSCAAIGLQTPPRFTLTPSSEDDYPTTWLPPSPLARSYLTTLTSYTSLPCLASEVIEVYWGLRNVSQLKEMTSRLAKPAEIESYTDIVERLERRTVAIIHKDIVAESRDDRCIFLLFGNAALIHIYLFMRDMPGGLLLAATLSTRILTTFSSLSPSTLRTLQPLFPEFMLWVFIMAGIGGIATPNRKFFAGLAADSCQRLGIEDADGLASVLGEWLWSRLYKAPVTGAFWRDVAVALGDGGNGGWETRVVEGDNSMATFNVLLDVGE